MEQAAAGAGGSIRITLLALDGCMASAVTGAREAFDLANRWQRVAHPEGAFFQPEIVSPGGGPVQGFAGTTVEVDRALEVVERTDALIVPPLVDRLDAWLTDPHALPVRLVELHGRGAVLAGVCTGVFLLAEGGLLDGRRATTNAWRAGAFARRYPKVAVLPERRLVDEGSVVTAGSTTSFLHLAVHLIERLAGHELAVLCAKTLAIDPNAGTQRPFFLLTAARDHGDAAILALQEWMEERHAEPLGVGALARRASMSARSLNRRFREATGMTPLEYLQRVRVESAKALLESTRLAVEEVTACIGYADPRSFGRLFQRHVGLSPSAYRRRFGRFEARSPQAGNG